MLSRKIFKFLIRKRKALGSGASKFSSQFSIFNRNILVYMCCMYIYTHKDRMREGGGGREGEGRERERREMNYKLTKIFLFRVSHLKVTYKHYFLCAPWNENGLESTVDREFLNQWNTVMYCITTFWSADRIYDGGIPYSLGM